MRVPSMFIAFALILSFLHGAEALLEFVNLPKRISVYSPTYVGILFDMPPGEVSLWVNLRDSTNRIVPGFEMLKIVHTEEFPRRRRMEFVLNPQFKGPYSRTLQPNKAYTIEAFLEGYESEVGINYLRHTLRTGRLHASFYGNGSRKTSIAIPSGQKRFNVRVFYEDLRWARAPAKNMDLHISVVHGSFNSACETAGCTYSFTAMRTHRQGRVGGKILRNVSFTRGTFSRSVQLVMDSNAGLPAGGGGEKYVLLVDLVPAGRGIQHRWDRAYAIADISG